MSESFLGEIRMFSFNFAPRGWALCNGQLLPINQNQALFSLLGTMYGGNGTTTFALPDLQGRVPIHVGQGAGLSSYIQGQIGGQEMHTLSLSELPSHTHALQVATTSNATSPAGNVPGAPSTDLLYRGSGNPNVALASNALASAGGSQAHPNMQPYAVVNFAIALEGIFPSRN